ncbi:MAG TPA: glutamate racemase [Trueperaceae bacterium]|nr:glutamate racemase [Trueperaceae bacterium]
MFDSGVGGLTVLNALMATLPDERFVYLGDTARLPYGSKPLEMVRGFASEITAELVERGVKAIVIACNTASAASLPDLALAVNVPVWGVIEPGVDAALTSVSVAGSSGRVAVLGTEATIRARAYQDRLESAGVTTWSRACPLFVPIVEEGVSDSTIAKLVADHYLNDRPAVDAVILGCTHYPLLKPVLREVLGPDVVLIDSSEVVARVVAAGLAARHLLRPAGATPLAGRLTYLVTGDVGAFMNTALRLGGVDAPATWIDLGDRRQARATGSTSTIVRSDRLVS